MRDSINIYDGDAIISRVYVEDGHEALETCLEPYHHVFAVMDKAVALYCPAAAQIAEILNRKGVPGKLIDAGEESKTMDTVLEICSWLLESGADRDALVVAIGGGITSDMVGFAASIYKRGVRFAYVPTTLLAQIDAAIGGKTGVNFEKYKNILGVIRQPEFTYICPRVLTSLSHRDFLSGAGELLKTFIIEDNGWYEKAVGELSEMSKEYSSVDAGDKSGLWRTIVGKHTSGLVELIAAAAAVKCGVVSRDPFERGERRKLNLGHTFAHAIETLAQMDGGEHFNGNPGNLGVTHGEAVAMGMVLAARLSDRYYRNGEPDLETKIIADLGKLNMQGTCPYSIQEMAEIMKKDKKAENGAVHFVLPRNIGDVTICDFTIEEVCRLMSEVVK